MLRIQNPTLKVIALATSLMIMSYVRQERNPNPTVTKTVAATVRAEGVPKADLLVTPKEPVMVEVTGPKSQVETVADNEVTVVINVATATADTRRLQILRCVAPPTAPDVTFGGRNVVNVDVKLKQSKSVLISPRWDPTPLGLGSHYTKPVLTPQYATVVGAGDEILRVARVVCFIETRGSSIKADLPLKAVDRNDIEVPGVTVEPATTHVQMDVVEAPAMRTVLVDPRVTGKPAAPYELASVTVEPAQVGLSGKPQQLLKMANVPTIPISVEGVTTDFGTDAPLSLPSGVTVTGSRPFVRVTVRLRDTSRPANP